MTIVPFSTPVEGLTLRGSLSLPGDGTGRYPAVALFHGFGGNRTEGARLFVTLARALNGAGFAVLAWDRAGHGESDGEFFDTHVTQDVRHAHAVLAALAARPEIDPDGIHLVGLSLGSVIAAAVAAGSPVPIPALVMWSTAAVFVDDIASGQIQGRSLNTLDTVGYFDFMGQRMGPAMVRDARDFDPYAAAAGYRGPTLLLHGTEDFVPARYAERYLEVLGPEATLEVVPGADHGWMTVPHRDHVIARTVQHLLAHRSPRSGGAR